MATCVSCGLASMGASELCPHHACVYGDDFAVTNRIYCDGLHRGKWPARLPAKDRDDMIDNFYAAQAADTA